MSRRRSLLVPEVVQTSAMDCGPATLKALLGGFGVPVSYGRLREACQIDLDGTSIDTLEEVAVQLGLDAEQVLVPADHLLLPEARCLPALVVVRQPNGMTHFVVAWRRHGGILQVMDPATGRRWTPARRFLEELYLHRMTVPVEGWREWAASEEFLASLGARLREIGMDGGEAKAFIAEAVADPGWRSLAALDACVRMTRSITASGGVSRGREAVRLVGSFVARCRDAVELAETVVPAGYWSVRSAPDSGGVASGEQVAFRGAVLVRVRARRAEPALGKPGGGAPDRAPLSPELAAALAERPARPGRELLRLLTTGGRFAPGAISLALLIAGLGVALETLFFRAFFDLGPALELGRQRAGAIGMLFAVIALFLLLDLPIVRGALRLGRHLETRLRMAFLRKVPRLGDRYFQSRLISDMAERSHSVHRLRLVPDAGESALRAAAELLFTLAGIVWLDPGSLPLALATGALTLGVPLVLLPRLHEWDLRVRIHAGALSRFYLDALLGLFPIRTHGAQKAVRRQHEGLLVEWARSMLRLGVANTTADAAVQVLLTATTVVLLFDHLARKGLDGSALLLVYWALKVLSLGHMLILIFATQYPGHRNTVLRLLEPLGAPEDGEGPAGMAGDGGAIGAVGKVGASGTELEKEIPQDADRPPVALWWGAVSVRAAGHTILDGIDLEIEAGRHVAIVGPSGAGKSTLVGTLLGWHRPASGQIRVDGVPLGGERLARLRRETAWVDPAVQIWNRSLLDNLRYGGEVGQGAPETAVAPAIDQAIRQADLAALLRQLPEGLQTPLGEGGGLVSGGEGQRVRLARALHRPGVRLVILDEPFRGLDREQRRELLARARRLWRRATLLCVTHDVGETLDFERVLLVEGGRIVEDGRPEELAAQSGSRYRALLDGERDVREALWKSAVWRRLRMERGQLWQGEGQAEGP